MNTVETNKDIQLQVLPASDEDQGTQRCRVGPKIFQKLGARLGSAAWVTHSKEKRFLCTLWPRCDNHNGFIQISDLVSQKLSEKAVVDERYITSSDIDLIPDFKSIKTVHVEIVVRDYVKVAEWRRSSNDVLFKLRSCLRNLVLSAGCEVRILDTALGTLLGLAYIKVKTIIYQHRSGDPCQTHTQTNQCGKVAQNSDVIVDAVLSSERFEQSKQSSKLRVLGGVSHELTLLEELVSLPYNLRVRSPGLKLPRGVLLQGPPGCGKTSLVRQLAAQCEAYLLVIHGPEVFASRPGETEHNLDVAFRKVEVISEEGPCVLFLDEVDALCPARGRGGATVERRVVSKLLTLIDHVTGIDHVTVIGATNNPADLDPAIRRPGRLEKEVFPR